MNLNNPKIKVPATGWERFFNLLSVMIIIASIVYAIYQFDNLPDRIPTHFNAQGKADGWGNKSSLFILPAITTATFLMMYFLNKVPHIFNLPVTITEKNASRIYRLARTMMAVFNFEIVLILSYATYETVQAAHGYSTLGLWFILFSIFVPLVTMILFFIPMNRET
ncbi:DUF1648 domain-containing protein [Virgibacillus siamensis]|uniref:DUF1648 domain-containing protein n=1 Tax=Virgibacillus siamensis TaxID=480071 RepID=UPI0009875674|nr:DUF1648 domain-containing protein [Virgibacillus siamensis]